MPMIGISVISWKMRHEANKKPPNMLPCSVCCS
jgi:hypothetical protein